MIGIKKMRVYCCYEQMDYLHLDYFVAHLHHQPCKKSLLSTVLYSKYDEMKLCIWELLAQCLTSSTFTINIFSQTLSLSGIFSKFKWRIWTLSSSLSKHAFAGLPFEVVDSLARLIGANIILSWKHNNYSMEYVGCTW